VEGLSRVPKQLPAWFLYDAEGSRLFGCDLPGATRVFFGASPAQLHDPSVSATVYSELVSSTRQHRERGTLPSSLIYTDASEVIDRAREEMISQIPRASYSSNLLPP